jgi:hypothetical protein
MNDWTRHLPFASLVFLILVLGLTLLTVSAEPKIYVTLLAPILWLGLYLLGSDRAQ